MFKRSKKDSPAEMINILWDETATQALKQAVNGAPVPGILKTKLEKDLKAAAEKHAQSQGKTTVTAEDLMQGLLARMPAGLRAKVENAIQQGPEGLESLKKDLESKK